MYGSEAHGELATLIQRIRQDAGLTQQEMAERASMSVAGLRDVEQGRVKRPRVSTLRGIAVAAELSPAEVRELVRLGSRGPVLAQDLHIRVLGPQLISVDGKQVVLSSERQRTMLGLLALAPGVPTSLDRLVDAAWGVSPPMTVSLIRSHMSRLRRRIQPRERKRPVLVAVNGGYALQVEDNELDLLAFRRLVVSARRDYEAGRGEAAVTAYRQAMGMLRDTPLADLPALQELPVLAELRRELETALLEYADAAASIGRHEEVLTPLYRFVGSNSLHESAHARLMTALAGSGQPAVALELFESLRRQLAEELGVDPGAMVRERHQAILRGLPVRAQPNATPLPAPVERTHPVPTQLPADVYGFTGRSQEIAQLNALLDHGLAQSAVVIAILPGRPGVGKSSLAVHWGHQVAKRFSDGQLYAELGARAPADVLRSFLLALGVDSGQVPDSLVDRSALLRSLLTGRRVLMLLDNARSAEQVRPLLPGSRGCAVLITSQSPLPGLVAAEGARPLIVDRLSESDSLTLLQRRLGPARTMAEPGAVREILERCEGLPAVLVAVATRALTDPRLSLSALAQELRKGYLPDMWSVESPWQQAS
jgi:DNA-binding SARP family transcriptional activator